MRIYVRMHESECVCVEKAMKCLWFIFILFTSFRIFRTQYLVQKIPIHIYIQYTYNVVILFNMRMCNSAYEFVCDCVLVTMLAVTGAFS